MNKRILPLALPLLLFAGTLTAQTPAAPEGWRYLWGDEFDGTQIDTTLWSKISRGGADVS